MTKAKTKNTQNEIPNNNIVITLIGSVHDMPFEGGINGKFFRIKRGIPVSVPMNIAKLIASRESVLMRSEDDVSGFSSMSGMKLC